MTGFSASEQLHYYQYGEDCFACENCGCDFLFTYEGERTNGMEMKWERDDYVNKLRDAINAYFQDFKDQFEKIG